MLKKLGIDQSIVQMYGELSPSARKIANYIQRHPFAILTMSVADIAAASKTSKATVSRFFRQLGYRSHQQAKEELLKLREGGLPLAKAEEIENDQLCNDLKLLKNTFDGIEASQLINITKLIVTAPKISIIGFRNSYPLALHFRQQLKQIRGAVRILPQPGQTLSEELVDLEKEDLVILLGFRRRPKGFGQLVESLKGKSIILLTDPSGQIFNQQVEHILVCHLGNDNAFDSYSAPMSVISMLCNKVYQSINKNGEGHRRIEKISSLYKQLDELSAK
ncbi:MurR/RpiR family transcriptional regulator [Glaciecola petra]|uniref:MurR/RpiR family transcriptional regulator n=1 Tax=Glaciecola petra TaxID=3075602 RepID=A0ABU2ZUV0_9ALTE|nr:MurR/RpiR family transcriptional regulator [Aestuariibacter sp. P117]MDT0596165.1 MurR/RpiR family transcriptional regulator [Aestuariibacter sp. P117]